MNYQAEDIKRQKEALLKLLSIASASATPKEWSMVVPQIDAIFTLLESLENPPRAREYSCVGCI